MCWRGEIILTDDRGSADIIHLTLDREGGGVKRIGKDACVQGNVHVSHDPRDEDGPVSQMLPHNQTPRKRDANVDEDGYRSEDKVKPHSAINRPHLLYDMPRICGQRVATG